MRHTRLLLTCLFVSFASLSGSPARAQITPDQTLGVEASVVIPDTVEGAATSFIEGGATRGSNLFHSFSTFNIDEAQRVYFDSPAGIESILSRVTGNSVSTINGLLGTTGDSDAALMLMNPNGIVFGENASLDVQGAFVATTATGVLLGENGAFSAVEPEGDLLLAIDPSAFFFGTQAAMPSEIRVESGGVFTQGLSVSDGETMLLLGGNVVLDDAQVTASGGRVEIGAIVGLAVVDMNNDGRIIVSDDIEKGSIRIENSAVIDVRANAGGEVRLIANNIDILSSSRVVAGIQAGSASSESKAGSLILEAAENINISGFFTQLSNDIEVGAIGQAGDIVMRANSIVIDPLVIIASRSSGSADAGDVILEARDLVSVNASFIFNVVSTDGTGQGGNVRLSADNIKLIHGSSINASAQGSGRAGDVVLLANNIELTNGATIRSTADGNGEAGNIVITASESVKLADINNNGSVIFTNTSLQNERQGGNIELATTNLEITGSSRVSTSTSGRGNAGSISLNILEAASLDDGNIQSLTEVGSTGRSGNVDLTASTLNITNGGQIIVTTNGSGDASNVSLDISERARFDGFDSTSAASSFVGSVVSQDGTGRGGNVEILATNLDVTNGALLSASTSGMGNAGNLSIRILETARFEGVNPRNTNPAGVSSNVERGAEGQGGEIELAAANLEVTNGAQINASTGGIGDAGRISIDVSEKARFEGTNLTRPSSINSAVAVGGIGSGGSIDLTATTLEVVNGGRISASTLGDGNAGNIALNVFGTVRVDGSGPVAFTDTSGILSSVDFGGQGDGGNIAIAANNLEVKNGAVVDASGIGSGNAGSIDLAVIEQILIDDGAVSTLSIDGSGGQIVARAEGILLRDGDFQTAVVFEEGAGGDITLIADYVIALEDSDILTFSVSGVGGAIDLSQTTLFSQNLNSVSESPKSELEFLALNGNGRVDVDATGDINSGEISINDASFIDNDLTELTDTLVETETLIAGSCIVRSGDDSGTLAVRGSDRPTQSPTSPLSSTYSLGTVQPVPTAEPAIIQEPQGIYQLNDGRLVISRRCE